jgi:hypothetical protein
MTASGLTFSPLYVTVFFLAPPIGNPKTAVSRAIFCLSAHNVFDPKHLPSLVHRGLFSVWNILFLVLLDLFSFVMLRIRQTIFAARPQVYLFRSKFNLNSNLPSLTHWGKQSLDLDQEIAFAGVSTAQIPSSVCPERTVQTGISHIVSAG